jgi:hypothetical protein
MSSGVRRSGEEERELMITSAAESAVARSGLVSGERSKTGISATAAEDDEDEEEAAPTGESARWLEGEGMGTSRGVSKEACRLEKDMFLGSGSGRGAAVEVGGGGKMGDGSGRWRWC